MGVPKLFKIILDKFPKSHSKVGGDTTINYLFIDFNSLIYESYEKIKSSLGNQSSPSRKSIETRIIKQVVQLTLDMIKDVNPTKMVYLALDGCPPRGKMIEQRSRRYKKLYADHVQHDIQAKHEVNIEPIWDRTFISPGTEFMLNLSTELNSAILMGRFPRNLEYVLSDTTVAGEGEHKFLPYIDALSPTNICIYSNDGDILILVSRFPQHKVYILTKPRDSFDRIKDLYQGEKYMYVNVQEIDVGLLKSFRRLKPSEWNQHRIKKDFAFYTIVGGNDFVRNIFFLKMKEEHTPKVMFGIYQALLLKHGYMINEDLTINQDFMLDYLRLLGRQEQKWLIKIQERYQNHKPRRDRKDSDSDDLRAKWEKEWDEFQHNPYYKRNHPQFGKYKEQFYQIDFTQRPPEWKKQYYKTFFNVDYTDKKKINHICFQYIKSWIYCFQYYFKGVPSWNWYYPFAASPLPSDMVYTMYRIKNVNQVFKFKLGKPFKPLEQLMLILPNKNALLPAELKRIQRELPEYYPSAFSLHVLWGQKFIYSDPELPDIDVGKVMKKVHSVKLKPHAVKLNTTHAHPLYYPLK